MKKSTIITILSIVAIVPMLMLVFSIKEAKAVQNEINTTPEIAKLEPRSYEWGKYYPRQYGSYMQTKESSEITDVLEENPALGLSLYRRNPYLDPLNNIQITLLSRYRNPNLTDEQRDRWLHPLLRSINAIASGMRNTG